MSGSDITTFAGHPGSFEFLRGPDWIELFPDFSVSAILSDTTKLWERLAFLR